MFGKPNQTKGLEELLLLNEEDLNGINDAFVGGDEDTTEARSTESKDGANKYTIKYNGEYIELPISELIVLAQKGMDYDRIRKQRDKLRAAFEKKDDSEFLISENSDLSDDGEEALSGNQINNTDLIERAALLLKKELGKTGVPDIAKLSDDANETPNQNEKARFIELFTRNPELAELPDEVYKAIAEGVSPVEAYNAYEKERLVKKAAELEEQIEALKNNEKNRTKALSSLRDDAPTQSLDDFISGLFG